MDGKSIASGVAVGVAIGVATDHLALGSAGGDAWRRLRRVAPAARMKPANDAHARLSFDDLEARLAAMPDDDVRKACLATDGMPDHDVADLLAGECERRNLDL